MITEVPAVLDWYKETTISFKAYVHESLQVYLHGVALTLSPT